VVLLCIVCFAIINALTLYLLLVPIPLGRTSLRLLHCPEYVQHDPLNFALGLMITATVAHGVHRHFPRPLHWRLLKRELAGVSSSLFLHGKAKRGTLLREAEALQLLGAVLLLTLCRSFLCSVFS
jgi:hypothetical protein